MRSSSKSKPTRYCSKWPVRPVARRGRPPRRRAARGASPPAALPALGGGGGEVPRPAAAKLLAENNLSAANVAGSGKDGRVTKGDALAAVKGGVQSTAAVIPTGVPTKALTQVSAPAAKERSEERRVGKECRSRCSPYH